MYVFSINHIQLRVLLYITDFPYTTWFPQCSSNGQPLKVDMVNSKGAKNVEKCGFRNELTLIIIFLYCFDPTYVIMRVWDNVYIEHTFLDRVASLESDI